MGDSSLFLPTLGCRRVRVGGRSTGPLDDCLGILCHRQMEGLSPWVVVVGFRGATTTGGRAKEAALSWTIVTMVTGSWPAISSSPWESMVNQFIVPVFWLGVMWDCGGTTRFVCQVQGRFQHNVNPIKSGQRKNGHRFVHRKVGSLLSWCRRPTPIGFLCICIANANDG